MGLRIMIKMFKNWIMNERVIILWQFMCVFQWASLNSQLLASLSFSWEFFITAITLNINNFCKALVLQILVWNLYVGEIEGWEVWKNCWFGFLYIQFIYAVIKAIKENNHSESSSFYFLSFFAFTLSFFDTAPWASTFLFAFSLPYSSSSSSFSSCSSLPSP